MTTTEKNFTGVTLKSGNGKLGKKAMITYRKVGLTCPSTCEYLDNGCYAQKYGISFSAKNAPFDSERFDAEMTIKTAAFLNKKYRPSMLRFHTSGDVMFNDEPQMDYIDVLTKWADIYKNRLNIPVINYTHAWKYKETQSIKSFTRASVHNVADAQQAAAEQWHVAYGINDDKTVEQVKQELKDVGLTGVHCIFQTNKIHCEDCLLCEIKGSNKRVIIFTKH